MAAFVTSPVQEFTKLHVDDGQPSSANMARSASGSSVGSSRESGQADLQQAGAEGDKPPMLLRHSSAGASSGSSFSRKSSIRSTDSVAAVPVRSPVRTPLQTPAMSRTASGFNYPGVPHSPPTVLTDRRTSASAGSPSRPLPSHITNGSRSPPPATRMQTDSASAAGHLGSQSARATSPATHSPLLTHRLPTHIQTDPPTSFHIPIPPDSDKSSPGSSTFAGSLPPTPSQATAPSGPRSQRPELQGRSATTGGSSAPPVNRRTAKDFEFGPVLGEGSYSTVYAVTDRIDPTRQYALKVLDKRHIVKVSLPIFLKKSSVPHTALLD